MTTTQETSGEAIAKRLLIKSGYAEPLSEQVDQFNAVAINHGTAWDQTFIDCEVLLDEAEELKFADFKKKTNGIAATRLQLLQDRLKMFSQRRKLINAIDDEISDRIQSQWEAVEAVRNKIESGLREAGKGPEDRDLWKQGRTNLATVEFNKEVEATDSYIAAQRQWRYAKYLHSQLHHVHNTVSQPELKAQLRNFVGNLNGSSQL